MTEPEPSMPPFAAGQAWRYITRPGEEASRVIVCRVAAECAAAAAAAADDDDADADAADDDDDDDDDDAIHVSDRSVTHS